MALEARTPGIAAVACSRSRLPSLTLSALLSAALPGCGGHIKTADYPAAWPPRTASVSAGDCPDITGTYAVGVNAPLLPFLLFGITDEASPDWLALTRLHNAPSSAESGRTTVTVKQPDTAHIEVAVAVDGRAAARQVLTRADPSASAATGPGQHGRPFRCEAGAVVLNSAYVHDWQAYELPEKDKKSRYRKMYGVVGPLGVSEGFVDFSKARDGSLVARVRLYGCFPCNSLDEYWQRWPSAPTPPP